MFIRGVNLGGWLLLERFITPYLFAVNSCQLRGDFCWYPGQLGAPTDGKICDPTACAPHRIEGGDYPVDEYTLLGSFSDESLAEAYLRAHRERFVTRDDLRRLGGAGVTHVRVPVPHWILGGDDIRPGEPWVAGGWPHFRRLVGWCRELGLEVWPDVHTAPGSQNGFDNSGRLRETPTCEGWGEHPENVRRSLDAIRNIAEAIRRDGMADVVTGFGVLNEPFGDCPVDVVRNFDDEALAIVRSTLGANTSVYIGDLFNATKWNDGWWTDPETHANTYLDSHYYHVFAEKPRALSPKQHIAYVCGKNSRDTTSCCYDDAPENEVPSGGIRRLVGEWSASFDTLPVDKLEDVMAGIARTGVAPEFDRVISPDRRAFLRQFARAQMVAYEAADRPGVSAGWFYWTLKMEGGAFAEWDFLRGLREGWIETLRPPDESSEDAYGTCRDIAERTPDDMGIVHEFPDPKTIPEADNWQGVDIDDDFVISHAGSMTAGDPSGDVAEEEPAKTLVAGETTTEAPSEESSGGGGGFVKWLFLIALGFGGYAVWRVFFRKDQGRNRSQYQTIGTEASLVV